MECWEVPLDSSGPTPGIGAPGSALRRVLTFFRWEMQVRELLAPGIGFSNFEFRFGLMRSHQELENVNLPCQGREHGFRVDHREMGFREMGQMHFPPESRTSRSGSEVAATWTSARLPPPLLSYSLPTNVPQRGAASNGHFPAGICQLPAREMPFPRRPISRTPLWWGGGGMNRSGGRSSGKWDSGKCTNAFPGREVRQFPAGNCQGAIHFRHVPEYLISRRLLHGSESSVSVGRSGATLRVLGRAKRTREESAHIVRMMAIRMNILAGPSGMAFAFPGATNSKPLSGALPGAHAFETVLEGISRTGPSPSSKSHFPESA